MAKFAVILPAAGGSRRFRDPSYKKPFAPLANKAVWLHSAERFLGRSDVVQTILVISPQDRDDFNFKFAANIAFMEIEVIDGGAERADSVEAALARIKPQADYVCVHDAVRPCLTDAWVDEIFAAAVQHGAAIFAVPLHGTLKRVDQNHQIVETISRDNVWEAQTPQVFQRELLIEAYAKRNGFQATDDAQLVERLGRKVHVVSGSPMNIKITTKEDQRLAEQLLRALPKPKLPGALNPLDDRWR